jgi:hypothetical protein
MRHAKIIKVIVVLDKKDPSFITVEVLKSITFGHK